MPALTSFREPGGRFLNPKEGAPAKIRLRPPFETLFLISSSKMCLEEGATNTSE